MPYSKDLHHYPDENWDLMRVIAQRPKDDPLRMPFPRRGQAISWRGRFHAWRLAVKAAGLEESRLTLDEFNKLSVMELQLRPTYSSREEKEHREEPCELVFRVEPEWAEQVREMARQAGVVSPLPALVPSPDISQSPAEDAAEAFLRGEKK